MMLATFFTSYSLKWISHIKVNSGRDEWENLEFIGSGTVNTGYPSQNIPAFDCMSETLGPTGSRGEPVI